MTGKSLTELKISKIKENPSDAEIIDCKALQDRKLLQFSIRKCQEE